MKNIFFFEKCTILLQRMAIAIYVITETSKTVNVMIIKDLNLKTF